MRTVTTICDVCRKPIQGVPGATIDFNWSLPEKPEAAHFCNGCVKQLVDALHESRDKVAALLSTTSNTEK